MGKWRRYYDEDEYYSKSYEQIWADRIGGLVVAGIVILIIVAIVKGIEWMLH